MKTKIVITDVLDFVLGMVMFFSAFAELFIFCKTSDPDNLSIMLLALSLGLRYIQDSTTKINFKEENNDGE